MSDSLAKLLDLAKQQRMTPEQMEAQRRSFAYGNTKIENDRITREMIDEAAEAIKKES